MNGEKLRKLREERGLTQRAVSIATNLTETTIGIMERGEGNPTLKTVKKLADFYGVSVEELI